MDSTDSQDSTDGTSEDLQTLYDAVMRDDLDGAEQALSSIPVDDMDTTFEGLTILHVAIVYSTEEMIDLLLENGADLNEPIRLMDVPFELLPRVSIIGECGFPLINSLALAVITEKIDIINAVLKHVHAKQLELSTFDNDGLALCMACHLNNLSVVQDLTKRGGKSYINSAKLHSQSSPLLLAAEQGNHKIVKFLWDSMKTPFQSNVHGRTILHSIGEQGNTKLLSWLLARIKGKNVRQLPRQCCAQEHGLCTPCQLAITHGHCGTLKVLLTRVCRSKCPNNKELLHLAARLNRIEIARYLLESGYSVNRPDRHFSTPLCEAIKAKQPAMVDFLLCRGADPNIPESPKEPPIIAAVRVDNIKIIRALLKAGADVNTQDITGACSLSLAASSPNGIDAVRLLLNHGADMDLYNMEGWSALLVAARHGNAAIVRTLLERGASFRPHPHRKASVLHNAICSGQISVIKLLVDHGADVNFPNVSGWTPLMSACIQRRTRILHLVRFLVEHGAHVNADTEISALHLAIGRNMPDVVQLLLAVGADVRKPALCCFKNALELAVFVGTRIDICNMLFHAGASLRSSFIADFMVHRSGNKSRWVCLCGSIPRLTYYLPLWMESCEHNEERHRTKFSAFTDVVLDSLMAPTRLESLCCEVVRKCTQHRPELLKSLPIPEQLCRLISFEGMK